jgi:hypothetical protein
VLARLVFLLSGFARHQVLDADHPQHDRHAEAGLERLLEELPPVHLVLSGRPDVGFHLIGWLDASLRLVGRPDAGLHAISRLGHQPVSG